MNSRRNVYDGLNASRTRRGPSALDDLERTLNGLEAKVGSLGARQEPAAPRYRDDIADRLQQLSQQLPMREERFSQAAPSQARPHAAAGSLSRLAGDIERARQEEENFSGLNAVSGEINRLRADIRALADRPADRSGEILRREIEELKLNVGMLAREDTLRSVGRSWEAFERRPAESDPAFEKLALRLEDIQSAVDSLPQSLSLQSLEDKVRILATALDSLSKQNPNASTEHLKLIEDRLDEISRAIVASSVSMQPAPMDPSHFDRIEARLAALAGRVEEIAEGDSGPSLAEHVTERIGALTERFDALTRAATLPEEQISRIAAQMEAIAHKISDTPEPLNPDDIMHGLENRLYEIASAIDKKSRDATDQTLSYFRDLEGRLKDLTLRIEEAEQTPAASGPDVMSLINDRFADFYHKIEEKQKKAAEPVGALAKGLEKRLDDITNRLNSTAAMPSLDPGIIRSLESQVQSLALQLDRPAAPSGEFDDIAPRLAAIENSLMSNRDALLDAARQAAEDALRNMKLPQPGDVDREAVIELAHDLKALEAMARKADDRNSRTFEAIHDTLLKVVDRLSSMEVEGRDMPRAPAQPMQADPYERSLDLGASVPALDPEEALFDRKPAEKPRGGARSPAQAAAAAAAAAEEVRAKEPAKAEPKSSVLGGLVRAVRGERDVVKAEMTLAGDPVLEIPGEPAFDPVIANQPLEPGNGAPDLNSIMKRVREERQTRSAGTDSVVKSDLIAAARRAAQAAAAEAEILKKAASKVDPGAQAGLGDLFNRQRKPILMAIGALIIALGGLQFGRAFLSDDIADLKVRAPAVKEKASEAPAAAKSEVKAPETQSKQPEVRMVDKPANANDAMLAPVSGGKLPPAISEKASAAAPGGQMDAGADDLAAETPAAKPAAGSEVTAASAAGAGKPMAPDEPAPAGAASAELPPVDSGPIALREAAASGDAKAQFEIAARYAEGRGVAKDLKQAAKYYTLAADAGFAPAQFRIGSLYEKGIGVERDAIRAKSWYQMAAEQGNASAMHNLAVLFALGASGPKDNDSAALWFTKAAELGVKDSQFNLGILAAQGLGVKQNLEDSYKWFALAANSGDKDAASKRDDIAKAMRPEQLAKARAATDLWKAKTADPAANSVEVPDSWRESQGQTASVGQKADMKKAIRNIQLILAKNGYDAGSPDGMMGGKTKKAIASYQASNGMKATGEVDEELVRSLLAKAK
jgi:localization factor PodJL